MANRVRVLMVPDADRAELERRAGPRVPGRVAGRARIVLLAATVTPPPRRADWLRIARKLAVSHDSAIRVWRRFCRCGPVSPGRQTRDDVRHGVVSLFAALNAAAGQVSDACYPRHRHQEFLRFLNQVARADPGTGLHVICGTYATHQHQDVREWLARPQNQQITVLFTPTSCSWLNLPGASSRSSPARPLQRASWAFAWTKGTAEIITSINHAKPKAKGLTEH